MPQTYDTSLESLVLVDDTNGITVIPQLSELRRLNWFDGKLLRADDLRVEQDHLRGLVRRANAAGGRGVVHGLTCSLGADGRLHVGPGVAVDPGGRSLVLPVDVPLDVRQLIDATAGAGASMSAGSAGAAPAASHVGGMRSLRATKLGTKPVRTAFAECVVAGKPGQPTVGAGRWYVITVGWAEGLCGNEEVYGRLCEDACSSSTDRPWRMDGLVFRARPIAPRRALATSSTIGLDARHERSLLASALFADEREDAGSMIFGGGLRSGVWCAGAAADAPAHDDVPIGVIARSGDVTSFLDVWIARRERIEPPPRRYWAGRMAMRPWEVFLAQILQFQCQLADVLEQGSATPTPGYVDPCLARQDALEQALVELGKRPPAREADGIDDGGVQDVVLAKLMARAQALAPVDRGSARHVLIDRGVVELPPAGYLPVDPAGPPTIETQIQALLGAGVDLTFCTTRADAVARELEAAQHLDRISLLRGLDDPRAHEQVDIVVPDAEIQEIAAQDAWHGFLTFGAQAGIRARGALLKAEPRSAQAILKGSGRVGTTDELTIRWAGSSPAAHKAATIVDRARERVVGNEEDAPAENDATRQDPGEDHNGQPDAWLDGTVARDPFALAEGESTRIELIGELAPGPGQHPVHGSFAGSFRLQRSAVQSGGGMRLYGVLTGTAETSTVEDDGKTTHHGPWHLKNEVIVESAATQDGATAVRASLRLEQGELRAVLTWRGGADSVELQAFAGRPDAPGPEGEGAAEQPDGSAATTTVQLAKLALSRDPDAATPANAFRVASERALNALQDALHEPGYAQERLRLLFPQQEAGLRLRATRDWVLFRRRAVLRCGGVAPARVVRETFAVFGVDRTERKVVSKPRPLGEITFDEGAAELAGSTVELGDAWTGDGAELRAIAVLAGPAGSEALYERRGQSLADLLAKTTPRSADFEVGLVPSLPLDPGEADGVMLVSVQQAAKPPTKTVNVAVVLVGRGFAERYLTRMTLATPDVVGALKLIMQEGEHFTVPVDFVAGSADPADESQLGEVVKLYTSKLGGPVQAVHVLSVKPVEDPSEVRGGRGSAVGRALGFDPPPVLYSREKEVFAPARDAKIDQNTMIVVVPSRG